ncbi:hypothetical protein BDN67DRAFT_984058, partial [Paxillus ammoniavirescens]
MTPSLQATNEDIDPMGGCYFSGNNLASFQLLWYYIPSFGSTAISSYCHFHEAVSSHHGDFRQEKYVFRWPQGALVPIIPLAEAQAASTNATCECPAPNPTSSNYRSVWSILGTCALTLLICIWNAAYPNITHEKSWYKIALYRGALGLSAL